MERLYGDEIQNSERINSLINELVKEVRNILEPLSSRAASESNKLKSEHEVHQIATNRGRELFFPYVGTGAGKGSMVELGDGSVKLDLINGIGIHLLGHSHPRVMAAAVRAALCDVITQGNLQPNREYLEFGRRLTELAGRKSNLKYAWLTTCGTMANEIALKISRQKHSPARMIMAMKDAFAGRSTLMSEITDNPSFRMGQPEYHEVLRVPFFEQDDPQSAEKSLRLVKEHVARHEGQISAFMFEPVQGEGGFKVAPREFLLPILEFCRSHSIAIWADEVQTFCRTGELFAFEKLEIGEFLDLCTIAKVAQVGATLFTQDYNPKPGLIAGTFAGSSVSLASGLEIINTLVGGGYLGPHGLIEKVHNKFMNMLARLIETTCRGKLSKAGGIGLMIAVQPLGGEKDKVNELLKILFANGLLAYSCGHGPYKLRFLVPACITDDEIKWAEKILEKSVLQMSS